MKILFLPTLNSPVVYYRMENFVKQFRKQGHEVAFTYWGPKFKDTCHWEHNMTMRFIQEIDILAKETEVTVIQSVHTQKAIALICALQEQHRKPVLCEYDDDIYSVNSQSPAFKLAGPGGNVELWGDEQIRKSDGVVVSTEYLKEHYSEKNAKIFVAPNAIDFDLWDNLKHPKKKSKKIKIGWEGGAGHSVNLRLLKNVVNRILDEFPNVVFHFKFGSYQPDYLQHKRIIFQDYHYWVSIDKHPQSLATAGFDIAVAPLRDLDFNRAKSNVRWLEYSALKIPTVASDVSPYRCIQHGKTGFIVKEEDGWVEYLGNLIKSESLRKHMGQMAYDYVKQNFNVERISQGYIRNLQGFI